MNIKSLSLNVVLMIGVAVTTALLVVLGTHYLEKKELSGDAFAFSLFSQKEEKEQEMHFVEIKNLVITLKGETKKDRYMLLDLALVTYDEGRLKRTEHLLPGIKGFTVDLLSNMDYNRVRKMSVNELRTLMMDHYQSAFERIGVKIPFEDVTFAKMVFK